MKIKKSRLIQIIKEELARVNEAERGYEDPAALADEDAQLDRILRGGMLGKKLSKKEEEDLAGIAVAGIRSGEYKDSNSPAGKALNQLLGSYYNFVYNVSARSNKRDDPSEVAQEAMVKAYLSLEDFREDSNFGTWLYRIASNKAVDFGRASQKELERTDYSVSPEDTDEDSQIYPIRQKILDPLQNLIQNREFEKFGHPLDAAVASLPEKDKKTFEKLEAFYEEQGLGLSDLSTGSEKYSKSFANITEFGKFISPEGTKENTAYTNGRRALKSLEKALETAGKNLGFERPVDESLEEAGGYLREPEPPKRPGIPNRDKVDFDPKRYNLPTGYDDRNPETNTKGPLKQRPFAGKLEEIIAEVLSELMNQ